MPYIETPDENILFIHIPKAGGSSIEEYLSKKYSTSLKLHGYLDEKLKKKHRIYNHTSMQHLTYENLYKMRKDLLIDFESSKLKIIASVRNPYDRILSDMFYNALISPNTTPEYVFEAMKIYLSKDCYDSHNHPQHTFVTKNGKLIENITIMKQENLTEEMKKNGYSDFNVWKNKTFNGFEVNYRNYLNEDSIKLINTVFEKDFELFGYEMM
jgi:hypothetical protein